MHTITIDTERCKGDGACAQVCPVRVFRLTQRKEPPKLDGLDRCVLCGQCLAVCPNEALVHSALDGGRLERIRHRRPVSGDGLIEALRQRRSVRVYKDEPVPRALLEKVVGVAGYAPTSAHGGEGWVRSVAVVTGAQAMSRVRDLTAEYMRLLDEMLSSTMVKLVARWKEGPRGGLAMLPDLQMRLAEHDAGRDVITYDAPAALFVHTPRTTPEPEANCHAPMMSILLAAHANGLGACWNGYLGKAASGFKTKSFTALREMLKIPPHHDVYAAATIGYPGMKLHSVPQRETSIRWIS